MNNYEKQALQDFLDDLDSIAENHSELGDTECRELLTDALVISFLMPKGEQTIPTHFGMFSSEGDTAVHAALEQFITRISALEPALSLSERLSLLNADVLSKEGNCCDEYFHVPEESDLSHLIGGQ